jgi:hypothetical protein
VEGHPWGDGMARGQSKMRDWAQQWMPRRFQPSGPGNHAQARRCWHPAQCIQSRTRSQAQPKTRQFTKRFKFGEPNYRHRNSTALRLTHNPEGESPRGFSVTGYFQRHLRLSSRTPRVLCFERERLGSDRKGRFPTKHRQNSLTLCLTDLSGLTQLSGPDPKPDTSKFHRVSKASEGARSLSMLQ